MNAIVELLSLPFVQRALIAGCILSLLAGVVGVITLLRKASFYGDAIAHSSLAGVAIGLFFGVYPMFTALVYAIIVALLLPFLRRKLSLSLDNVLGIILPVSMGLGVFIFSLLPGYQPEMMSFLFGNILTITLQEVYILFGIALVSVFIFFRYLQQMVYLSFDEEYATILGLHTKWLQRIYEVLLAVIVVAGVKLLGIVLINALLIIPASTAKNLSSSLKMWLILSPLVSLFSVLGGILLSVIINTPPGATIALFAGFLFAVSQVLRILLVKRSV